MLFRNNNLQNKIIQPKTAAKNHWRKPMGFILILFAVLGSGSNKVSAQATPVTPSVLYVPLIGITSVPEPLTLIGPGKVTYNYAVKNFIREVPLTNIQVTDTMCSPIRTAGGDDNHDSKLDFSETWRYTCTVNISETTHSTATATGTANDITAEHNAYATVAVGTNIAPPLVSIVNITKVANPLPLPVEGGDITFTYRVNNPGIVALSDVAVVDDKCSNMSSKLGDTNGNNLLDITEVWVYTCSMRITVSSTNTTTVTAFANNLSATDKSALTIKVIPSISEPSTNLFDLAIGPVALEIPDIKIPVWATLSVILAILTILFLLRKSKAGKGRSSTVETPKSSK